MLKKFIYGRVGAYCENHKPTKAQLQEIKTRNFITNLQKSRERSYFLVLMPFFIGALCYLVLYSAYSFSPWAQPSLDQTINIASMLLGGLTWWYASRIFKEACDFFAGVSK